MPAVYLTQQEIVLLERVCEQQAWEDTRRKLVGACQVCRGLVVGHCSHKSSGR